MENSEVLQHLQDSAAVPWVLIPFFFSDRGAEVQKTIEGLLQELLYQILSRFMGLVDVVAHIYIQALKEAIPSHELAPGRFIDGMVWSRSALIDASVVFRAAKSHRIDYQAIWTHANIDRAFRLIMNQSRIPLRLCFFIDALDEHRGDHRKLLDTIQTLAQDRAGSAQIKLCLASRPEPIFRAALSQYPGFAIQKYTIQDIKIYIHGRIESSFADYAVDYNPRDLENLTDEITNKASGVFLWVKLVVEVLIEGIIDGSNIVQLRQILAEIPEELQDLYRRVLQARKSHYALESYVMFQIVMHVYEPLSLRQLIAATDVVLFGYWKRQWEEDSPGSMRRRLDSRCGGLLELRGTWPDDSDEKVHLIHQTLKEFMKIPRNAVSMFTYPTNSPLESGSLYMLRFCIHLLMQKSAGESGDFRDLISHLFTYAASSDATASAEVSSLLQTMLQKTSFRGSRLSRSDDGIDKRYKVCEINDDNLALWEVGYIWALRAFPHKHERPLISKTDQKRNAFNLNRDLRLLLLAASSGCLVYTARKVADGAPTKLSAWQLLLHATLRGIVTLNLRGLYYDSNLLLVLLEDLRAGGAKYTSVCVSILLEPYERGTNAVSKGILECLVWLLDHQTTKPPYDSETWRRNCYKIWEILERYSINPPNLSYRERAVERANEDEEEYQKEYELRPTERTAKGYESQSVEDINEWLEEESEEESEAESEEDFDEEGEDNHEHTNEQNEEYGNAKKDDRVKSVSFKSVRRYVAHGVWYPWDGMWRLSDS